MTEDRLSFHLQKHDLNFDGLASSLFTGKCLPYLSYNYCKYNSDVSNFILWYWNCSNALFMSHKVYAVKPIITCLVPTIDCIAFKYHQTWCLCFSCMYIIFYDEYDSSLQTKHPPLPHSSRIVRTWDFFRICRSLFLPLRILLMSHSEKLSLILMWVIMCLLQSYMCSGIPVTYAEKRFKHIQSPQ